VIDEELERANLFLLMVSPDFIASSYCVEREMKRALERHDANEARVVPIIVQPCDWAAMPQLRQLKAIPTDGKPISEWANANNAYLNIVQEIRRIVEARPDKVQETNVITAGLEAQQDNVPRYRVQRDFDEIDRMEFREASFATIKDYFQRSIAEIDAVDGLRGRFVDRGTESFGSTVVNQGRQRGTAHITVHVRSGSHALADIYFAFQENAPANTANGGLNISSDEYEQFLVPTMAMFRNDPDLLSPEQAAEYLWKEFIEQAGIAHA
jgi:hypothetical protein